MKTSEIHKSEGSNEKEMVSSEDRVVERNSEVEEVVDRMEDAPNEWGRARCVLDRKLRKFEEIRDISYIYIIMSLFYEYRINS